MSQPMNLPIIYEDVVESLSRQVGALYAQLAIRDSAVNNLQAMNAELRTKIDEVEEKLDSYTRDVDTCDAEPPESAEPTDDGA